MTEAHGDFPLASKASSRAEKATCSDTFQERTEILQGCLKTAPNAMIKRNEHLKKKKKGNLMTFKEQLNTKEGEILINTLGSLRQYISFTESGLVVSGCPLKRSPCEQTQRKAGMHSDVPRSGVSIDGNIFSSEVGAFGAVGCCCCCCISEKSSQNQKFFFLSLGPPGQLSFKEAHLVLFMLLLLILLLLEYNHFEMVLTLNTFRIILLRKAINHIY